MTFSLADDQRLRDVHAAVKRVEEKLDGLLGRPPYPEGDVVGACICGSWPGGPCLRCTWLPEPPARSDK